MENTLATIDKAFKVEMMKMPPPLLNTKICDLGGGFLSVLCVPCLTFILGFFFFFLRGLLLQ